jgi:hypothetical protein
MLLNELQYLGAVHAGHLHVEKNDVVEELLDEVDGFGAIEGEIDFIGSALLQCLLQECRQGRFVVDDENFITLGHSFAGDRVIR